MGMADDAETRLGVAADRFEALIGRMEATARRECDCSLAGLRRENERLLGLLRAHPPPRPKMLPQRRLYILMGPASLAQGRPVAGTGFVAFRSVSGGMGWYGIV